MMGWTRLCEGQSLYPNIMKDRIDDAFAPPEESVDWANKAVADFKRVAWSFFEDNPAEVITEVDPDTGENVQKVRLKPLPTEVRRRASEALLNARHAFDQAVYAAQNLTSGHSSEKVYFPWAESPTDLKHLLKCRGIDERLWDTIAAHEPYPRSDTYIGGCDVTRSLATIANKKHTIGLGVLPDVADVEFSQLNFSSDCVTISSRRYDPVKNEIELLRWRGSLEGYGQCRLGFQIAFQDARLPLPIRALAGLSGFSFKADAVVKSLKARCLELAA